MIKEIAIPSKFNGFADPHRYKVAYGGRGCVLGDTLLDTPSGQVKIQDWAGGYLYAMTKAGVALVYAGASVKYRKEDLYTTTLSNGSSVVCTDEHRFLTESGWLQGSEVGSERVAVFDSSLLPSTLDTSPSGLLEDAPHCFGIILNYLYGYLEDCRLDGEPPHLAASTYLDVLPLLGDALPRSSHILSREGDLGSENIDTLSHFLYHLSSLSALLSLEAQDYEGEESYNEPKTSVLSLRILQALSQFHESRSLAELVLELCQLFQEFYYAFESNQEQTLQELWQMLGSDVGDETYSDSFVVCNHDHYSAIDSIEYHSTDNYYDLFVPIHNNYLANGIVHHNSGKSWSIATLLILRALREPTRILCAREIQKSIIDSCLQLLSDAIYRLGVEAEFDIQSTQILGKNGSRFLFEGLRSNISKIKSMEGIDIVWCEEADQVSATSWNTLIPTIRKPGSEIWVSFNPADEMDDTYQRFVSNPPEDCYSVKVNYCDNQFFPDELEKERLAMKAQSDTLYRHIWEGEPIANRDGAYWAKYIKQEQVMRIPIEPGHPVNTYWDLGVSDSTAIWFVQTVANEIRVVHSYENHGEGLAHYINYIHDWRDSNQAVMGYHYAPHDIAVRELGSGKSRLETARTLGIVFQVAPNLGVDDGIQAVRAIMPRCWFNQDHCKDGLRALKSYRKEFDDRKGVYKPKPLHDWSSHYADAFRYFALCHRDKQNSWSAPTTAAAWSPFD